MVDADVFSDVGYFEFYVFDSDGCESVECEFGVYCDRANDWVDGLGQGGDCAWAGVVDCGAVPSVLDLSAVGEE